MRGRVKFRVGRIVYLAFSRRRDDGLRVPEGLAGRAVEAEPEKFALPSEHDMRYHWVHVDLGAIDADEMRELVEDAWAFASRSASPPSTPPPGATADPRTPRGRIPLEYAFRPMYRRAEPF